MFNHAKDSVTTNKPLYLTGTVQFFSILQLNSKQWILWSSPFPLLHPLYFDFCNLYSIEIVLPEVTLAHQVTFISLNPVVISSAYFTS